MATPEAALINYLLADSGVSAIVGTKIYPLARPQGSTLPAVTVQRITGGPTYADDGETGLFQIRCQIDSYATSYGASKNLAAAIATRLSAVQDVDQSGITFLYIMLQSEQDLREAGSGEFQYEYRVRQDYIIWYSVTVTSRTAVLAASFAAMTLAAAGQLSRIGAVAAAFGAMTLTATGEGTAIHSGAVAGAFDAMTLTATGELPITGVAVPTFDAMTLTATGELAIQGVASGAFDAMTLTATGELAIQGVSAGAFDAMTLTATGELPITGVAVPTFDAMTLTATGELPITGAGAITFDAMTLSSVATLSASIGAVSVTLGAMTLSSAGVVGAASYPGDGLSGVVAAYSTRRLFTAYSGSAIRVRRSSDSTEQDIGFSGGDLDTSALTTFVGANDGYVVKFYDQSGNGYDLTPLGANYARVVVSGTVQTVNSKAAAATSANSQAYGGTLTTSITSTAVEFFQVFRFSNSSSNQRCVSIRNSTAEDWNDDSGATSATNADGSAVNAYRNFNGAEIAQSAGATLRLYSRFTTDVEFVTNGTTNSSTSARGHAAFNANRIGLGTQDGATANVAVGFICEVVVTNAQQSDYTTFFSNQATYWGL